MTSYSAAVTALNAALSQATAAHTKEHCKRCLIELPQPAPESPGSASHKSNGGGAMGRDGTAFEKGLKTPLGGGMFIDRAPHAQFAFCFSAARRFVGGIVG